MSATLHRLPRPSRALIPHDASKETRTPTEVVLEMLKEQGCTRLKSEALRYAERILKAEGKVERSSLTARADMAVIAASMLFEASVALLKEAKKLGTPDA